MFSFLIRTFMCFYVLFSYILFWFVTSSITIATSLGLPIVCCYMSKSLALKALDRLSITLKKLTRVGYVALDDVLLNHFICMF